MRSKAVLFTVALVSLGFDSSWGSERAGYSGHQWPRVVTSWPCTNFHRHVIEVSQGRIVSAFFQPVHYCGRPRIPDRSDANLAGSTRP